MDVAGVFDHYADSGPAATAVCILIDAAALPSVGVHGGIAGVVAITLDRYWMIVHPIHHRKYYRRWMFYAGLILPWLNGIVVTPLPSFGTTRIVDGKCYLLKFWPTHAMEQVCIHSYR